MISKEEKKAIEYLKYLNKNLDFNKTGYVYGNENLELILNLLEIQNKSIEILVAQKEEYKKDSDKWFKKMQEERTKFIKINDRKNKIIDKLITALAEERGTDEDEIREVFGCE